MDDSLVQYNPAPSAMPGSKPNILFLVFDTARAKTVLPELKTGLMPATTDLAQDGTIFTKAMSTAPWTLPSHSSMFTGMYTSDHSTHAGSQIFEPDVSPLPEQLKNCGYKTAAISGNIWISPEFGFDRGFNQFSMKYDRLWGGADLSEISSEDNLKGRTKTLLQTLDGPNSVTKTILNLLWAKIMSGRYDDGARQTTTRTINWIKNQTESESPFFYFINYLEPHLEYNPPDGFADEFVPDDSTDKEVESVNQDPWEYIAGSTDMSNSDFEVLEGLYKGELKYLDSQISRLVSSLKQQGMYNDTAIIVVGDHGENIGDYGLMDHQYSLYETLLHVPLILKWPDSYDSVEEHNGLVELRDLFPTILELVGTTSGNNTKCSSNSLVPQQGTIQSRDFTIGEYLVPQPSMDSLQEQVSSFDPDAKKFDRALRSIRTDQWKLIESEYGDVELYDLTESSEEVEEVSEEYPQVVTNLRQQLTVERGQLNRGATKNVEMSNSSKERLEELGYLQ
jgi:arylsulfatase A-like enzyme